MVIACSEWKGRTIVIRRHKGNVHLGHSTIASGNKQITYSYSHGDSDYKEGAESFTAEMTQLENVLQMLEEETMVLHTELLVYKRGESIESWAW